MDFDILMLRAYHRRYTAARELLRRILSKMMIDGHVRRIEGKI